MADSYMQWNDTEKKIEKLMNPIVRTIEICTVFIWCSHNFFLWNLTNDFTAFFISFDNTQR